MAAYTEFTTTTACEIAQYFLITCAYVAKTHCLVAEMLQTESVCLSQKE